MRGREGRAGRDLVNMAKKRPNVIPIIEDARHPGKYRMLVPMVDVIFADVAQPDQVHACLHALALKLLWCGASFDVDVYCKVVERGCLWATWALFWGSGI